MNESSRQERIIRTSVVGILVNLLIAAVKIMNGTLASSIAIVSEGINNATDAGSSFLTYIGTKLSGKHPDEKHPFGYGRIEYLTGMVVGVLILYAGLGMLKESVEGILHPSDMNVSILTVLIVAGTAVTKFILGMYKIKVGKSVESEVLLAVGEDGRNDSYFSGLTILSSVIFLFTGFSLDAYAGIVFSFVVIKSGVDTLLQLPDGILHFALSRNYVYCYSADTVYVYKTSGEFVKTIPLDFTLTGVTPLTDSTVLLRTETALYVMNLD